MENAKKSFLFLFLPSFKNTSYKIGHPGIVTAITISMFEDKVPLVRITP